MASGVKVVGTAATDEDAGVTDIETGVAETTDETGAGDADGTREAEALAPSGRSRRRGRARVTQRPRSRLWVVGLGILAVLGLAGTIGFGVAWAGLQGRQSGEAQASASARSFLVDLTNFDAKTVDADFGAITSMSTGSFATQAQKFFNSTIRQALQKALASSRGQVRSLYVQSYGGGQATVYAVVDQLYVNDKITSPQTDVLRMVVTVRQVGAHWKVADVTVLQGPTLTSGNSAPSTGTTSSGSSATGASGTTGTSSSTTPTT
ncbi:MAG: hypothetical protein ACRDWE_00100 [Acidimicrobiales bacterium]